MQAILDFIEADKINYYDTVWNKYDIYQKIVTPHLRSELFPWVIVIIALNSQNLKKPIILTLIAHFIIRYAGDFFYQLQYVLPTDKVKYSWPSSMTVWYVGYGVSNIVYSLGEIIGDWYPLLRTKAVTNNNNKVKIVYITCIIYNLSKVLGMFCYFYDIDLEWADKEKMIPNNKTVEFKIRWWSVIALMQLTSCIYDISVIYALKTCLFNRLKEFKNSGRHNFLEKFQRISEFRIVLSMAASAVFLPFVFFFLYINVNKCKKDVCDYTIDFSLESLRRVVICLNYNFMFIDQILIRRYAERSNERLKTMSTTSKSYVKSKTNNDSYNHEYKSLNYYSDNDYSKYNNSMTMNSTMNTSMTYNNSNTPSTTGLLFNENIMKNKAGESYGNPFMYNSGVNSNDTSNNTMLSNNNMMTTNNTSYVSNNKPVISHPNNTIYNSAYYMNTIKNSNSNTINSNSLGKSEYKPYFSSGNPNAYNYL
ncbi:hypothetical protein H8356DRAFT_1653286 [Neocallimastix lanati (nom. inval.)]|jgi:hypothetical protein|nr:hypothetical protein H8356DRAFT_1653286 [Neocallimastix sp. JGI-2020a]